MATKAKAPKVGTLKIIIINSGGKLGAVLIEITNRETGATVFEDFITRKSNKVNLPNGFYHVEAPAVLTDLITGKKYRLKKLGTVIAPKLDVVFLHYVPVGRRKTKSLARH